MAIQCFKIHNEYNEPIQNALVDVVVDRETVFANFSSPTGQVLATVTPGKDNIVYVRFNSYTPVQYIYNGPGGESCIIISIRTCQSLQQEPLDNGRFLIWNPVAYCVRNQTLPLNICKDNGVIDNVLCYFDNSEEEDYYALPVKNRDVIRWVMDLSEVDYNNDDIANLLIGITQDGVLIEENVGTLAEYDGQLFCTATIPCLKECEYEFVIYRKDIIDYIGLEITNPTVPGLCNGQIKAIVDLGLPPYEYSMNGLTWQVSDTFTGLCEGNYRVYARDSDCSQAFKDAYLLSVDCGLFKGVTLQYVIDLGITLGQVIDSGCTLCDFVPVGDLQQTADIVTNGSFESATGWTAQTGFGAPSYITDGHAVINFGFWQTLNVVANSKLKVTFDISNIPVSKQMVVFIVNGSAMTYDGSTGSGYANTVYTQASDVSYNGYVELLINVAHLGVITIGFNCAVSNFGYHLDNVKVFELLDNCN